MKKIIIAFAAVAAAFCLASCNKAQIDAPQNGIKFNISVASPTTTDTKAVKTGWVSGDKIFIWFDGSLATNPELTITYNGTSWEAGELASGVSENLQANGTMKYFYLSTNTWDTSDVTDFSPTFKLFRFPNHNQSGDVAYYATPMVLASHIQGFDAPTYTFADDVLSLSLDSWKFLTNTQVTVPVPVGTDADDYRLSFGKTGYPSYTVTDIRLFDSYMDKGDSSSYARGFNATDGAAFYLRASSNYYSSNGVITFTLVDMSSGSKKVYTFTTPSMKFPLSNGITIDKITGSGGCVENAFSAMKLPAFTGTADANWKIVE